MYTLSDLKTALDDPRWFARELNRLYSHRLNLRDHNPNGVDIFEEDWDNLVVLDACRYDEFEQHADLEGNLDKKLSRGATSSEFIRGNFRDRKLYDVVYVSANAYYPYLRDELDAEIHAFIGLHEDEYRDAGEGLTTHPQTVTEHALDAHEKYPNKRLIVHYFQPHQPYLGDYGKERFEPGQGLPYIVRETDPSREELLRAYRENLDIVLEEVEILLEEFQGKTVVTADHGELLGERMRPVPVRDYGHHEGVYVAELLEVPWLSFQNGSRKHIIEEPPEENTERTDTAEIEDHLQDLGYLG